MATIYSKNFAWYPQIINGDDPQVFEPTYTILPPPKPMVGFFESRFADLPAFGIWKDREKNDNELLEELGSGWRGFSKE
jgi:hypothetical protein